MQHINEAAAPTIRRVTASTRPTSQDVRLTAQAVERIRAIVQATDPEDDELLAGMVEGETDAMEMIDALLDMEAEAFGYVSAIKAQIDVLAKRKARMTDRMNAARAGMELVLTATGMGKVERAAATVSMRRLAPAPVVPDPHALPAQFIRTKVEADMAAIRAHKGEIPGVEWTDGRMSLTVRRT
jgi:acyl CoA:acetate/3-ketoacid CoA transferase alpha subunit